MIAAKMQTEGKPAETLLFILEPGNFAKLELGKPLIKNLRDFFPELPNIEIMICYTPDILYVGERLSKGDDFAQVMMDSLTRKEVFQRELDPEALKRQEIKPKT